MQVKYRYIVCCSWNLITFDLVSWEKAEWATKRESLIKINIENYAINLKCEKLNWWAEKRCRRSEVDLLKYEEWSCFVFTVSKLGVINIGKNWYCDEQELQKSRVYFCWQTELFQNGNLFFYAENRWEILKYKTK